MRRPELESRDLADPIWYVSGRLCLDFVNSSCVRLGTPLELLKGPNELRQWLLAAQAVAVKDLIGLDETWSDPRGSELLHRALSLRSALRELVLSLIERREAEASALATLNAVLRANPTFSQVRAESEGFREAIACVTSGDRWLTAIAEDAVDLLCHADLSLLRQCECGTCVRVFFDTTKNHKRRWCVEKCGSRVKAAAYYRRKRSKVSATMGTPVE